MKAVRYGLIGLILASAAPFGGWGSAQELSIPPPSGAFFQQDVAWSPAGERIAFSQLPTDGDEYSPSLWSVYTVDAAGGEPELVSERSRGVDWSPDGKSLVFGCWQDGSWGICVSDLGGRTSRRLTEGGATGGGPAWSPDGKKIAFHSERTGASKIYTMDPSGGDVTQVTRGKGADFNPAWSPDGSSIVFYRELGDGADQIWTVTLDGAETRITQDGNNNTFPAFRADGRIVFASQPKDGGSMLVHVDADGTGRTEVPSIPTFFARYSSDGRRIAFVAGSWPRSAAYVVTSDLGSVTKIVN